MGLRYSRYADDLTFSLPDNATSTKNTVQPADHNQLIGQLLGSVHKVLREEGFNLNNDKTRVIRMGNQHTVTGMVVNGEGVPRVPRKIKRMLRASLHNLASDQPLHDGETLETLSGYAAWIASAEPELGQRYLKKIEALRDQGKLSKAKSHTKADIVA